MHDKYDLPEGYVVTPMNRVDSGVANLMYAAQIEGQKRGHRAARSDLILLEAASGSGVTASTLLRMLNTDQKGVQEAVDAEWASQVSLEDEPRDAIRQAIFASIAQISQSEFVTVPLFLAALLRMDGSRASRVVSALGAVPADVAGQLENRDPK